MTEERSKQLLTKYLDGTAVPAEIKQVEDWYTTLNAGKPDVPDLRKIAIREQMLRNIQLAVDAKKIRKSLWNSHWLRIAAAIAVVVSITLIVWRLNDHHHYPTSEFVTTASKAGERLKINLSDGSVLTLEPLAKVSYPNRFAEDSRHVKLIEGEAFFSVSHDAERPFQVELPSDLRVLVLGTSFRIRSHQADDDVEVAVSTGKVAVSNQGKLLGMLTRNQHLEYNKLTGRSRIYKSMKADPVEIAFNSTTLFDVIEHLEYVYHIEISLEDSSLSDLKCTANFNSSQRPEEILEIICSLHHIKASSDNNHKTFKIYK